MSKLTTTGPLTPTQTRILAAIAQGAENADIAAAMVMSIHTVRSHVKVILAKLGARNRAHAVGLAFRAHIFETRPREEAA